MDCVGFIMNKEYYRVLLFISIEIATIFLLKNVLIFFLPLITAIAFVVPLQSFCSRHNWHMKRGNGLLAGFIFLVFLLLFILVIGSILAFFLHELQTVLLNLPYYEAYFYHLLTNAGAWIEQVLELSSGSMQERLYLLCNDCMYTISANGSSLIGKSFSYLADISKFCIFLIISFICIILFAKEIDYWKHVLLNLAVTAPCIDKLISIILRMGKKIGKMLGAYFRTQSCILLVISLTSIVGLFIAKVPNALIYGLLAGIFDMLPFIGTGLILLPWIFIQLIQSNLISSVVIIITYILCIIIREFLEPRLMGTCMSISPVGILISIYAGVMFYGIGGVLLGPVTLLISVELSREILATKSQ